MGGRGLHLPRRWLLYFFKFQAITPPHVDLSTRSSRTADAQQVVPLCLGNVDINKNRSGVIVNSSQILASRINRSNPLVGVRNKRTRGICSVAIFCSTEHQTAYIYDNFSCGLEDCAGHRPGLFGVFQERVQLYGGTCTMFVIVGRRWAAGTVFCLMNFVSFSTPRCFLGFGSAGR